MKAYPFASPDPIPGLYALSNNVTGQIYIGRSVNLRRRFQEWRGVFTSGVGAKSNQILDTAMNSNPADWSFMVLFESPNTSETELANLEKRAIQRVYDQQPARVLNTLVPVPDLTRKVGPRSAKSIIETADGKSVSYAEAAKALGCSTKSLQKRLSKRRASGMTNHKLEDLIALTEKYRKPETTM